MGGLRDWVGGIGEKWVVLEKSSAAGVQVRGQAPQLRGFVGHRVRWGGWDGLLGEWAGVV